jgi:hypothetical protein
MSATCPVHLLLDLIILLIFGASHSGRAVLAGWLLGSWVRNPLKAWMFVRVFLCCVVLCRQRPCDGLITPKESYHMSE